MTLDPQFDAMLEGVREPAIWLRRGAAAGSAGKLGGLPQLPAGVAWPRHGKTGLPLHFLAQVDLGRLPKTPLPGARSDHRLPASGMLFFFADMEEEMLWGFDERGTHEDATRVIHAAAAGAPAKPPADLPEISHAFGKDRGSYSAAISVYPEAGFDAFAIDTFAGAGRYFQGDASRQADLRTVRSIERATGQPAPVYSGSDGWSAFRAAPAAFYQRNASDPSARRELHVIRHQMLGAATDVQGTAKQARAEGWVSLLQLDSDRALHTAFMFCDMGMAQFWILPEDLRNGRFDRAWATTEGG